MKTWLRATRPLQTKLCFATPCSWFVHVPWMSFLIPLCHCLFRSHEEHIIRPASNSVSVSTESRLTTQSSRISCLIIRRACGFTQLLQAKKGQERQLTNCQEVWTVRQEGEYTWLLSECGPSESSQNRICLSCLMSCFIYVYKYFYICPHSKGSGTQYTMNGTMHASTWKSKKCLVANSYDMIHLPQCIVDGLSDPNKAVRKVSGTKQTPCYWASPLFAWC